MYDSFEAAEATADDLPRQARRQSTSAPTSSTASDASLARFLGSARIDRLRDPDLSRALGSTDARGEGFFEADRRPGDRAPGEVDPADRDTLISFIRAFNVGLTDGLSADHREHRAAVDGFMLVLRGYVERCAGWSVGPAGHGCPGVFGADQLITTRRLQGATSASTGGHFHGSARRACCLHHRRNSQHRTSRCRGIPREGAKVVVNGKDAEKGAVAVKEMGGGENVHFIAGDVTKKAECEALVQGTVDHFGRIDILLRNAGGVVGPGPVAEMTDESMADTMTWNFWHTFWTMKAALAHMIPQEFGRIIATSSVESQAGHARARPTTSPPRPRSTGS